MEPYRVDLDPSVTIPIESIESGIRGSDLCLADITLDNPNVWFEVGYAIAAKKEIVFICSSERRTRFPFDVQHRAITKYATTSPRGFEELRRKITQRLKAILKSNVELRAVSGLSPRQETGGLAPHEVAALVIMMEYRISPDSKVSPAQVGKRMRRAGFTDVAVGIALHGLLSGGYIDFFSSPGLGENQACSLTPKALQWLQDNQETLLLKINDTQVIGEPPPYDAQVIERSPVEDEDIPF